MEFLEGKDLAEVIEEARSRGRCLPAWFAIHIAIEVLQALHHATIEAKDKQGRLLGLIHRDISPQNIFVCADGRVKLMDFGVARVQTAEVRTQVGVIKGKFGYMSPEQLVGAPLDFRSDLYNVGILLYEMLTAAQLFHGATLAQFVASMMKNQVPQLSHALLVPRELDALMRRSLATDREVRPAHAAMFAHELAAIAATFALRATPAHVAAEMGALFPELLAVPEPPAETAPAQAPSQTTSSIPDPSDDLPPTMSLRQAASTLAERTLSRDDNPPVAKAPPPTIWAPVAGDARELQSFTLTAQVSALGGVNAREVPFDDDRTDISPTPVRRPRVAKTPLPHRVSASGQSVRTLDGDDDGGRSKLK